jgi:hypothetical protein
MIAIFAASEKLGVMLACCPPGSPGSRRCHRRSPTVWLAARARAAADRPAPGGPAQVPAGPGARGRRRRATGSSATPAVLSRAANPPPESAPAVPKPRTAAAPRTAEGGTTTATAEARRPQPGSGTEPPHDHRVHELPQRTRGLTGTTTASAPARPASPAPFATALLATSFTSLSTIQSLAAMLS